MEFFILPLIFIALLGLYFLPTIVAHSRNHPSFLAIFIVNLLLAWSLIGWVVALVWSFADLRVVFLRTDENFGGAKSEVEAIEKLAELRDRGIITEQEFNAKKKRILEN